MRKERINMSTKFSNLLTDMKDSILEEIDNLDLKKFWDNTFASIKEKYNSINLSIWEILGAVIIAVLILGLLKFYKKLSNKSGAYNG